MNESFSVPAPAVLSGETFAAVTSGGAVSMPTFAVAATSPPPSGRASTVCMPSPLWSWGARTCTRLPSCQAPPSMRQPAATGRPSASWNRRVTGPACQRSPAPTMRSEPSVLVVAGESPVEPPGRSFVSATRPRQAEVAEPAAPRPQPAPRRPGRRRGRRCAAGASACGALRARIGSRPEAASSRPFEPESRDVVAEAHESVREGDVQAVPGRRPAAP